MDNFYTSVPLLRQLHSVGICAAGTVRSNRKFSPKALLPKSAAMEKHDYKVAQARELTFSTWMDTKAVCALSNYHSPTETGTVNRRSGHQEQQQVVVPSVLADYQRNMKGVDLCDQMLGYYMPGHRSKKWWRRVFAYLTVASAHNAYVIAKDSNEGFVNQEWPAFQDFLEDLIDDLISGVCASRAPPILLDARQHRQLCSLHTRQDRLYKVCHECKQKGLKGRNANKMCTVCYVPVHLMCLSSHQKRVQR